MKLALLALTTISAFAQSATYTFSQQGAEVSNALVGSQLPGEQVISAIVCGAPTVSGGAIYQQAVAQGYQPISNLLVPSVTTHVVSKSFWQKFLLGLGYGTIITAEIGSGGALSIGGKALTSVLYSHDVIDKVSPMVQASVPNPSALLTGLVDASQTYNVTASGCYQGLIVARFLGPGPLQLKPPQIQKAEPKQDVPTTGRANDDAALELAGATTNDGVSPPESSVPWLEDQQEQDVALNARGGAWRELGPLEVSTSKTTRAQADFCKEYNYDTLKWFTDGQIVTVRCADVIAQVNGEPLQASR